MTRRSLEFSILAATVLCAAQIPSRAADLIKSAVLESNVAYLRIGTVETNLPAEIQSAQKALATNKTIGTVLDLRFADGADADAAKGTADLFAQKKLPLAILVNGETHGAAAKLAEDLRGARAGLIFGDSTEVKPDVDVVVKPEDEKQFLDNPYATLSADGTNAAAATNRPMPFVDHTSEADLVRARIKDGDQDGLPVPTPTAAPPPPVIRDPVLARAVDLIKGLAIVRAPHS